MSEPDTQQPTTRAFADTLAKVETGFFEEEIDERLREVIESVRANGKPGSVTVKLDVKPIAGDDGLVQVVGAVGQKLPKVDRAPTRFWITREGGLSRQHPSQITHPAMGGPEKE